MKIILAITEDRYGCSAIAELIRKLEENKKIDEIKLDCHSMGGKGNIISAKTVRIVKSSIFKGYDRIMIFVDSDNEDSQILENRIKDMLKRNSGVDMNRVCIIVFNPHIEILLAPQENNPLEYLRTHDRYEKSDLPKRIRNIDLNTVYKLEVFQKIVKTLNDP